MDLRLEALFAELDACETSVPSVHLQEWIKSCPLGWADVVQYCRYHPDHYVRNLMHAGPAYHALVLCWRNGQRSPIHDHSGSGCAVRVLLGEAVETAFEIAPNGMLYPVSSRVLAEGETCYSEDADVHQLSNLQAGNADLVTLHIYSPPLMNMNIYSLLGDDVRRFYDPVNDEFTSGAGI